MSENIRLLMGITLSEVGGSQKVVFNILSHLPESIYDITLVTSPGGELLDWIDQLNQNRVNKIEITSLDCIRRDISPIYDFITFFKLISLMKKGGYDIAHFHNSKMGILGRIAAKICGIPKIYYTMHGLNLNKDTTGRIYPILSLIENITGRFSTKVVFVSNHDMDIGIRNGWASETNSCLIYNGIAEAASSERTYIEPPNQAPVIAFVARLAEPKAPEFAIRITEKLLHDGFQHKLMIIGDGPKMEECKNLIHICGIEEQVSLLGRCDNVMELLAGVDIFSLFSKWEGFPISIIEAMMCGLPVVASNVGGIPELIEHGKTGYLVPDFDEELAVEYLKKLIIDKEERDSLGNQARTAACSRFNVASMVSQYRELYEE